MLGSGFPKPLGCFAPFLATLMPHMGISNRSLPPHQAEQEGDTGLISWERGEPPPFKSSMDSFFSTSSTYCVLRMLLSILRTWFFLRPPRQEKGLWLLLSALQLACKGFGLGWLEFFFCRPLSSPGSRQREAAALRAKPELFLCYITIWAFRLVFPDIGRCVKYWHNPVVYMESRLALSGACTRLVFSLNTRACSIVKATLQQSPGKQGEKTFMSWPDPWDYSCPGTDPGLDKKD